MPDGGEIIRARDAGREGRKPHPNSLDTILTNPMMVIKEDGDGQQTWETDATQQ
jgi:hypothetical protein